MERRFLVEDMVVDLTCWPECDDLRCGDDDLSIDQFLVEFRILAIFVGGRYQCMSLILKPFANSEFVLGCAQEFGDILGVLLPIVEDKEDFDLHPVDTVMISLTVFLAMQCDNQLR